jgi:hypothetical protein
MVARKYSASMDEDLLDAVRAAAEDEDMTLSAWLAEVARERVALLGLQRILDEWQEEHGAFTEAELDAARQRLANPLSPKDVLRSKRRTAAK